MKWNSLDSCLYAIALCLGVSFVSCTSSNNKEVLSDARTQIILRSLDVPFLADAKDTIIGSYVDREKIDIPLSLVGQNKWLMFEGPVLENDLIAYRFYADSRHRFDIYGKKVSNLVMDTVSWDYHTIMDWGSDILKVGSSLGIGSPAVVSSDTLWTLSSWGNKTVEILHSHADSVSLRTTFTNLVIDNDTIDLIQDWKLKSGSSWSTIDLKITKGALKDGAHFATGFVKHLDNIQTEKLDHGFLAYNFGNQSFHKQDLGMGVFVPSKYEAEVRADKYSHLVVSPIKSTSFSYSFVANWSEGVDGVRSELDFMDYIKQTLND